MAKNGKKFEGGMLGLGTNFKSSGKILAAVCKNPFENQLRVSWSKISLNQTICPAVCNTSDAGLSHIVLKLIKIQRLQKFKKCPVPRLYWTLHFSVYFRRSVYIFCLFSIKILRIHRCKKLSKFIIFNATQTLYKTFHIP